jgi:hypothetical protein
MIHRLLIVALALLLSACGDECSEYSGHSCKELARARYNTFFYFPNSGKEEQLGVVTGLAQCGEMARSYAVSKELTRDSGWSYVCCLKTDSSECAEKHR